MATRRRAAHRVLAPRQDVDGVLVRLAVEPGPWAEDIPPVPAGFTVTVSFGSDAVAEEHRDALELLGYRIVDVPVPSDLSIPGIADFLVLHDLMEQHPTYWRSLALRAERAYHLALGPAAAAVSEVTAQHLQLLP